MRSHYNLTRTKPSQIASVIPDKENNDLFYSCGDDGTLRVWDAQQMKCLSVIDLNIDNNGCTLSFDSNTKEIKEISRLRSLDHNPKKGVVAVGCQDGTIRIVYVKDFYLQVAMFRHRRSSVGVIKLSPDGNLIAVGCDEGYIDIYSLQLFKVLFKIRKNNSPITHLDWSTDSKYIQYNNKEEDIHYVDAKQGQLLNNGSVLLRDEPWSEWSCKYGWPTKGLYDPSNADSKSVASIFRSPKSHHGKNQMLAAGMLNGEIRTYRYPCLSAKAESINLKGHSGVVTDLCFSINGNRMYSEGSEDLTILQWRITVE